MKCNHYEKKCDARKQLSRSRKIAVSRYLETSKETYLVQVT